MVRSSQSDLREEQEELVGGLESAITALHLEADNLRSRVTIVETLTSKELATASARFTEEAAQLKRANMVLQSQIEAIRSSKEQLAGK